MKNTYVYAIQEDKLARSALVKIGLARSAEQRLINLQVGNPRRLMLRAKIGPLSPAQAVYMEKDIHEKLKRFRLRGEWFSGKCLPHLCKIMPGANNEQT